MNGPEIFNFTLRVVPALVDSVLSAAGLHFDDIDLFVAHQANEFMLKHLRDKLAIPVEKFPIEMAQFGNTVSSTVPLTLARLDQRGLLISGMKIMILGFGVGLSWAGSVITWR
jgi:3-oxoacyl-[acyl-carrier-protein] synthase-3